MATTADTRRKGPLPHIPMWLGSCIFLVMVVFLLTTEHRAHILGAAPYVLLLLCPIIHFLMHGGHGGREDHDAHQGHTGRGED